MTWTVKENEGVWYVLDDEGAIKAKCASKDIAEAFAGAVTPPKPRRETYLHEELKAFSDDLDRRNRRKNILIAALLIWAILATIF